MNSTQAKEVLRLYRPGMGEESDPETATALERLELDPELEAWFEQQQAFHAGVRRQLRCLMPPPDLRQRILNGHRSVPGIAWWRRPEILALAAAIVVLICLAGFWMPLGRQNTLSLYRFRMAKFALREYRMNLVTDDLKQIRAYLSEHGAPADYGLSPALERLPGAGCALLTWQNQPVSLICFRLGKNDLMWLFVVDRASLSDAPVPAAPILQQVGKLATATWSRQGRTYVLAAIGDPQVIQNFL